MHVWSVDDDIQQPNSAALTHLIAHAVVSKDIPPDCTAVGIPAKPIKFHGEQ